MQQIYPLVTIAIPTYNRAAFLAGAVDSALKQTYRHLEVLVLDNCSTDNTRETVSAINDPRVRYIRNESNLGMTGNFNRSLELFRGDYWVFLPDDDRLLPGYCEACLGLFHKYPDLGLVSSPDIACDPSGRELWRYPVRGPEYITPKQMWKRLVYMGQEVSHPMVARQAIESAGFFDASFPYLADYDYWVRVSTRFPAGYVQGHYSVTTSHPGQASTMGWQSSSNPSLIVGMKTVTKAFADPSCPLSKLEKLRCLWREGDRFFMLAVKLFLQGKRTMACSILQDLKAYESLPLQAVYSLLHSPVFLYKGIWRRVMIRRGKPFMHKYA